MCTSLTVSISVEQAAFCLMVISNGLQKGTVMGAHCVLWGTGGAAISGPALGRGCHLAEGLSIVFGKGVTKRDRGVGKKVNTSSQGCGSGILDSRSDLVELQTRSKV